MVEATTRSDLDASVAPYYHNAVDEELSLGATEADCAQLGPQTGASQALHIPIFTPKTKKKIFFF